MKLKFYVCRNGAKLFLRNKINRAISKVHSEIRHRGDTSWSIRINGSHNPLMCFRCGGTNDPNWIYVGGDYETALYPPFIDKTFKPKSTK